mmetsp:Transcript_46635/g.129730  ORF Transcript_46635/g.129730 Transcript_46635/m.129730 type:complete len:455 (-) Transcript_46635:50-1414(-)
MPRTGKKAELAKRITEELCDIWKVMNATASSLAPAPVQAPMSAVVMQDTAPENRLASEGASTGIGGIIMHDICQPAPETVSKGLAEQELRNDSLAVVDAQIADPEALDSTRHAAAHLHSCSAQRAFTEVPPGAHATMHAESQDWERQDDQVLQQSQEGQLQPVLSNQANASQASWWGDAFAASTSASSSSQNPLPLDGQQEWKEHEKQSRASWTEVSRLETGRPTRLDIEHDDSSSGATTAAGQPCAGVVETEAVADAAEVTGQRRRERQAERRVKLMKYLAEEVAGVYGGDKDRYIADMREAIQDVPDEMRRAYCDIKLEDPTAAIVSQRVPTVLGNKAEAPEFAAWHSEPFQDQMQMVGEVGPARTAWCKWWDNKTGCGELIDVVDFSIVAVVSAALSTGANVSPRLKFLHQGEFVEYRRVDSGRGFLRALLVRGIRGWPLMCEVSGNALGP